LDERVRLAINVLSQLFGSFKLSFQLDLVWLALVWRQWKGGSSAPGSGQGEWQCPWIGKLADGGGRTQKDQRGEREGEKWGPPQITPTRKATRAFARLDITISNVTF